MTYSPSKLLSFEQFLVDYGDNSRYELIDGELRDMEPTGPHEEVSGNIAGRIYAEILRSNLNWLIPKTCLIKPPAAEATALRPDVIVLDKAKLSAEPLWQKEPIICNGNTIQLVADVVSTNWQDDYYNKIRDYETMGISEYWIVDYAALGGRKFIGNPKVPTIFVCELIDGEYQMIPFRGIDSTVSPTFPQLNLTAQQIFNSVI